MQVVHVGEFEIAYERRGTGPALVLLHGVMSDSRFWKPQLAGLADRFDVIAWDSPGAGKSSDPPESFTLADFADCLAQFLDALSLQRAVIAGLSWGGILALEFYRRHPKRVQSLILADTYAGWKGSLPDDVVRERLTTSLRESEMAPEDFVPGWLPGLFGPNAPEPLVVDTAAIMSDFHPVGYRTIIKSAAERDLRDVLPTISVPTLLIWGEADARSPVSVGEGIRDALPGARLVVIRNAGHVSSAEQPEQFNTAIGDFWEGIAATETGGA